MIRNALRCISEKIDDLMYSSFLGSVIVILGFSAILMAIIFGLAWIFSDKTDQGECLQYHSESYTTFMMVNKVMVPMTQYRNVCDVWEYPKAAGVEN